MTARSVVVVAWGASSALGEGDAAFSCGVPGERGGSKVGRDEELAAAGLARPYCARVPLAHDTDRDRATVLFERTLDACLRELDVALSGWRERRVGLAVGTSSGGMRTFERATGTDEALPLESTYLGPVLAAEREVATSPFALVLGACASSTIAIGLARAWLLEGACDVALAGGFDAVGPFVASGFEVLRATSAVPGPRPFRSGRDGLALGEGAAMIAMARREDVPAGAARAFVRGFGASCDAAHLTAPSRTGAGLAASIRAALEDAGATPGEIDLVSAHGTATGFNDDAEARAIESVFASDATRPFVHAFKGAIGHALGAAGALEALASIDAMRRGVVAGSNGEGEVIHGLRVLDASAKAEVRSALKLSSAFGGANAALVVSRAASEDAPSGTDPRPVFVSRAVALAGAELPPPRVLAERTGYAEDRIARGDGLVQLTIAAVSALAERTGALAGAGIVVGHGLATIETNIAYLARVRAAGVLRAEPRRFPFTTPNACAGEAAIAFGLTGPAFAVGGGPHGGIEAVSAAASLVRAGVAERIVVVAADEVGRAAEIASPGIRSGAVALLVSREPLDGRLERIEVRLDAGRMPADTRASAPMHAHAALVPLAADRPAGEVSAATPWGGFAKARFFWL